MSDRKAFYTPSALAELLVRLVDPQPGESICDPGAGDGALLRAALGYESSLRVFGQELDEAEAAKAHASVGGRIECGDTMRDPRLLDESGQLLLFDAVVANPPFAVASWGQETWQHDQLGRIIGDIPPKRGGDWAWISHVAATLNDRGRAAILVSAGPLFRGVNERRIRAEFVRRDLIDTAIALSPGLFAKTPVAVSILMLRRRKPAERSRKVLFIDASGERGQLQVERIIEAHEQGRSDRLPTRFLSTEELQANDFDLTVARHLPPAVEPELTEAAALARLDVAEDSLEAARRQFMHRLAGFTF